MRNSRSIERGEPGASPCARWTIGRRIRRSPRGWTGLAPDQRAAATAPPGPIAVRRSRGERQDDDARGPDRLADRRRGRSRDDRGHHVQQASRGGARAAARRRPSRRSASPAAPCASGRSTRSGRRSSAPPGGRWSRSWTGRRSCGRSPPAAPAVDCGAWTTRSRGSSSTSASPPTRSRPIRRPVRSARAFVAYERAIERLGGLDFDDLVARGVRLLEADPAVLDAVARACAPPPRRRGPGRRPEPAPARAAPRRAGEPDLPRRRRRPVDLRLAAGRRAPGPGARRARCRACAGSTS